MLAVVIILKVMERIIEMLKQDYDTKNRMLNVTPPTTWFDLGLTQENWIKKKKEELKELERAINILEAVISE